MMPSLNNFDTSNTYTLKSIDELYNTHSDINRVYHFQYKSEEAAKNFANLTGSFLDKESHHTIHDVESSYVSENKTNLIMETNNSKIGTHVIAYNHIPKDYQFDIISSPLDGKTLVIYDNAFKKNANEQKPEEKV